MHDSVLLTVLILMDAVAGDRQDLEEDHVADEGDDLVDFSFTFDRDWVHRKRKIKTRHKTLPKL